MQRTTRLLSKVSYLKFTPSLDDETMTLCIHCQSIDFRKLLLQYLSESASGPSHILQATTAFYPDIFSLRSGSDNKCGLCSLIWNDDVIQHDKERTYYFYNGPDRPPTDEELGKRYEGPLFLSVEETGGKPMKVRFRVHGEFTETESVFSYTRWSSTCLSCFRKRVSCTVHVCEIDMLRTPQDILCKIKTTF